MEEDDLNGEVISLNGESTDDTTSSTPEDRGDIVTTAEPEAAQEDPPEERKTSGIPKARFDEVNEAKKAAQAELEIARAEIERLKQAPKPAPTAQAAPATTSPDFDEDAKEEAYIEAMLEGDTAKAKEIRKEINQNLRLLAAIDVETRNSQRQQADSLQAASSQAVEDYPYLDTPDGEFALGLIVSQRNADIARGVAPHVALANAVKAIAPKFAPDDGNSPPTKGLPATKAQVDTRTQNAIERGAADSLRQPAPLQAGIGNRADAVRVNVQALDEDQFANLSLADKKRLRGD
jgi:hypothetical protein